MAVTPPLDEIPKLPPKAVNIIMQQIQKLLDQIFDNLGNTLTEALKLPEDIKCDDPRVKAIKDKLKEIQALIGKLQDLIPIINKIVQGISIAIKVATAAKATIFLTPVVGQAALMAELAMVQNHTIASAMTAIQQFRIIPSLLQQGVTDMALKLAQITNRIGQACPGEEIPVAAEVAGNLGAVNAAFGGENVGPQGFGGSDWLLLQGNGSNGAPTGAPPNSTIPNSGETFSDNVKDDGFGSIWMYRGDYYNPAGISWGSENSRLTDFELGTEFYSKYNVHDDDLNSYVESITKLARDQENLLASLKEAPAQSHQGSGPPNDELGKLGDYYIDTANNIMYGPKIESTWPQGINY